MFIRGVKMARREQRQITKKYRKLQKARGAWQRWYNKWYAAGRRYNQLYDKTGKEKYARMARKTADWVGRSDEQIGIINERLPYLEERYKKLGKYIDKVSKKYRESADDLEDVASDYPE